MTVKEKAELLNLRRRVEAQREEIKRLQKRLTYCISRDDGKIATWQILESMGYSSKHNDRLVEEVEAVFDDIPGVIKNQTAD